MVWVDIAVTYAGAVTPPDQERADALRLAAVRRYDILDTPPDGAFDRVAALAARIFRVPIATVSIVDEDRVWFKASSGLAGVTQVGVEPGLCASVIKDGLPYQVTDAATDPRTVDHPLVQGELGLRFYAAAPIVTSDGHRLGTVNVIGTEAREVTDDEMAALQDLAAIVMDELELRLSALATLGRERELREQIEADKSRVETIARTLQDTLLPPHLPAVPGLEIATHYQSASAESVGGDFYDLFALDDAADRLAFFIGDVCGKGVLAAAITSLARYTLRAAAIRRVEPHAALAELNTALLLDQRSDEDPRFVTAIYSELTRTPDGFDVCLANGGHPPAVVIRADGTVESLAATGTLLGVLPGATYESEGASLAPGDALLLYTDGITDPRDGRGARYGEEAFATFLEGCGGQPAEKLLNSVLRLLDAFDPPPDDDVALLAISVA
jgi:sigma-B regulation protein RsbU (phosphoserine phosphatase)